MRELSDRVFYRKSKCLTGIDDLWKRYKKTRSNKNRNALVEAYMYLVVNTSDRFESNAPRPDNLLGAACEGLIQAVEKFDPDRGNKFSTLALWYVKGRIADYLRKIDPKSRSVRSFEKKREEARIFLSSYGYPTEEEICQHMGLSWELYSNRLIKLAAIHQLSDVDMAVQKDNRFDSPENEAHVNCFFEDVMADLDERSKKIIWLYYHEGWPAPKIGKEKDIKLTHQRVHQLKDESIERYRRQVA